MYILSIYLYNLRELKNGRYAGIWYIGTLENGRYAGKWYTGTLEKWEIRWKMVHRYAGKMGDMLEYAT